MLPGGQSNPLGCRLISENHARRLKKEGPVVKAVGKLNQENQSVQRLPVAGLAFPHSSAAGVGLSGRTREQGIRNMTGSLVGAAGVRSRSPVRV